MLKLMKVLNFSSVFHLMRAVSVAGKYSIFNRSLKLTLSLVVVRVHVPLKDVTLIPVSRASGS